MPLLYSILSTILSSLWLIVWKKSLEINKTSQLTFFFLWWIWWLILSFIFLFMWYLKSNSFWNIWLIILTILVILITIPNTTLSQKIYKTDKISNILPYEQIWKVITIISSFFLFHDASITSLFIAIITVFVVIWFSIDFKTLKFPKSLPYIIISQTLLTIKTNIIAYILLKLSSVEFYIVSQFLSTIIYFGIIVLQGKIYEFKQNKKFYKFRLSASFIWSVNVLISYFLLSELWVVYSILLSFLWVWTSLLFSYIVFKDKPTKKNIIMTIIVLILVWIWFYFKK